MAKVLFGSLKLIECLNKLGFRADLNCKGHHPKFHPPTTLKIPMGVRPFMMLQLNQKQYDKHDCSRYITELVQMGFDRKTVISYLKD